MNTLSLALLVAFGLPTANLLAASQVATVTRAIGKVQILTNPGNSPQGKGPHVLYEKKYYNAKKARRGSSVKQGSVVQTGAGARARIVYDNGDQITLSPSSSYQIRWNVNQKDSKPVADVLMGKFRAVVRSKGPRSGMQVRTRSMVMGVRGTDFHVNARSDSGDSEVTVLRGKVAVRPKAKKVKPVEIPAGYSAEIGDSKKKKKKRKKKKKGKTEMGKKEEKEEAFVLNLKKTSKQELIAIQETSKVQLAPGMDGGNIALALAGEDNETAEKIKKLEAAATKNTLEDIKENDPKLFKEISKKKVQNVDEINTSSVDKLVKKAPTKSKVKKIRKPDLDALPDVDAYDKYFKIDD